MCNNALLKQLRMLEVELHQPDVRANVERLDELLHDSFFEIGRSGSSYTKSDILLQLPAEKSDTRVLSQAFDAVELSPGIVLLTYDSVHVTSGGELNRFSRRSSIWVESGDGWQVRFHQGTATDAFETYE